MRYVLLLLIMNASLISKAQSLQPIGNWREHLPYGSSIDVTAASDRVYAATPFSLFSVLLSDRSIERYSRVTGLSETGISAIKYDAATEQLFIAYTNSNIDILYRNDIYNIPDIKRDNIIGDKTIYNIYPRQQHYYLSTGLGVIVINGDRFEIKDSWFIGNNGNQVKVNGFTSDATFFYAATEEGLKKALINSPDLSNYANWQIISGSSGLSAGPAKNVFTVQDKVVVEKNDSLFIQNGTTWSLLYTDGWPYISTNTTENKIQLSERFPNGTSRVVILNADGSLSRIHSQAGVISFPRKAIVLNNETWVADQFGGLSHFTGSSFEQFKPNSPEATASGEMVVHNSVLYVTAGEVNDSWNYMFNSNGIYILREGVWENINRFKYSQIDSLLDYITIAIDRRDGSVWAGSYGGGLLRVRPGPSFTIYKQNFIGPTIGDPNSYRVSGLAFDNENNLWIANYGSSTQLRVRKADSAWVNITIPISLSENAVSQIIVDDNNYKWIVSPKGNGLLVFNHGSTIENTGDDKWRLYRGGSGNGNLPNSEVLSIAKDKNGFIWVGTTDGIGVIQCPQEAFTAQGCAAILPVVQQGNFAGYLFKGEEVRSIAVDGADRKWVATKNGVWLVSADGTEVIYQFTEDNSPLLSSDVRKITIDGATGEVFFATLKGIISFRSTATEGGETNSNVLVFPNPVPPGYEGTIAIKGLVNNAIVKIIDLSGRLVFQAKALGGTAIWNGRDYRGGKIASGVYLVLVSDDTKSEKIVSKVVFIGR